MQLLFSNTPWLNTKLLKISSGFPQYGGEYWYTSFAEYFVVNWCSVTPVWWWDCFRCWWSLVRDWKSTFTSPYSWLFVRFCWWYRCQCRRCEMCVFLTTIRFAWLLYLKEPPGGRWLKPPVYSALSVDLCVSITGISCPVSPLQALSPKPWLHSGTS